MPRWERLLVAGQMYRVHRELPDAPLWGSWKHLGSRNDAHTGQGERGQVAGGSSLVSAWYLVRNFGRHVEEEHDPLLHLNRHHKPFSLPS